MQHLQVPEYIVLLRICHREHDSHHARSDIEIDGLNVVLEILSGIPGQWYLS